MPERLLGHRGHRLLVRRRRRWHHEAFESFLDARGRLDGLLRGEAVMAYVQRTVCMNTADAIDPGIQPVEVGLAAGEWVMYQLQKGRE